MWNRNRETRRALLACLAILGASALATAHALGTRAGLAALCAGILASIPWIALTVWRYGKIRQLSRRLDEVLHGERELALDHMDEGELAILTSEIDKMTARLTRTAENLSREHASLADALTDISHQIKTPLTSLSITTELVRKRLVERGDCGEEVQRLRRIERLQERVQDLVSALLRLARLDAGALTFARERVDVRELVDRAVEPLAVALDIADVALVTRIETGASFTGDISWSAEALGNIIKNCMEHTPAGGTITLQAHEDTLACRIRIEDTGTGIADEDLPHVFERFYRGTHGASQTGDAAGSGGAGIGLALSRSLITAQNGQVTASNARDSEGGVTGACFDISFFKDTAI